MFASEMLMLTWLLSPVSTDPLCRPLQDICVSRMSAGSRLYHGLLEVLSDKLSGLSDLQADLRDLLMHINKVTNTPDVTSYISSHCKKVKPSAAILVCGCQSLCRSH